MAKSVPARSQLLAEVLLAIQTLPIRAQFLEDEDNPERDLIHGYCDYGDNPRVTVNEAIPIVDVLVHEALHAIRQSWKESTVDKRAGRLFRQLSNDEIHHIYQQYRRRVRRAHRKRVV